MDLSNENIIHMKKDGIEYLQFRRLLEFDNLINCYTLSANDVDFRRKFPNEKSYILDNWNYPIKLLSIDLILLLE